MSRLISEPITYKQEDSRKSSEEGKSEDEYPYKNSGEEFFDAPSAPRIRHHKSEFNVRDDVDTFEVAR
jgi:hypothetical protein